MRTVKLVRKSTGTNGTFGQLTTDKGFNCFTVERPEDDPEHPCIPELEYLVKETNHPIHGVCYEVQNVPNRSAILIHSANWARQLLGCIAPGSQIEEIEGTLGVASSQETLERFVEHMEHQPFILTISEEF